MSTPALDIEEEYQRRIRSMTPAERVARGAAMFAMVRESIARRLVAEHGDLTDVELKWRVALELYGDENESLRNLIQKQIDSVSR